MFICLISHPSKKYFIIYYIILVLLKPLSPDINFKQAPISALVPFKADIIKSGEVNFTFRCRIMAGARIKTAINPGNIGIHAFLTQ